MLVYKIMGQNIQILNKTVVIAITLHVYILIACDERRQSPKWGGQVIHHSLCTCKCIVVRYAP